jgi:hypothetical protein
MKLFFLRPIILCFLFQFSFGQTKSLQSVRNELLCNVFDYKQADSATVAFLRANFPYLAKPVPQGGLILPPFGSNYPSEVISMRFRRHPFFDFNIREGRVDFETVVTPAHEEYERRADLWLIFDREADAQAAFQIISDTLSAAAKKKKMNNADNGQKTAEFSETVRDNDWQVKLILKRDDGKGYYTICLTDADD